MAIFACYVYISLFSLSPFSATLTSPSSPFSPLWIGLTICLLSSYVAIEGILEGS